MQLYGADGGLSQLSLWPVLESEPCGALSAVSRGPASDPLSQALSAHAPPSLSQK